jgi:hypothetical protein
MRIGQGVFLLAGIAFAVYATRLRSTITDRLIYLVLAGAGCVLVLYPDWSTEIAHRVGIGRGVDLVIYLFIVFSLFHYASGAAKSKQTERALTVIVRRLAIADARPDASLRGGAASDVGGATSVHRSSPYLPAVQSDRQ